ncbi:hypothetical protein BC829DRAFT_491130 [Chytridium lagenaria]|nr:hypothetical protein BC829DRAFT_491130 [Chytridium lagenaria]
MSSPDESTRSSLAILDFALPGFLLEQTSALMFPLIWHISLNHLWLLQCLITISYCLYHQRWMPMSGGTFRPWAVKQFKGLLILHAAFYIVELYTTNMWFKFTQMAIHHSFALLIFTTIYLEPNSLSVTTLIPFILHALYWTIGASSDPILYTYNFILGMSGMVGLHQLLLVEPIDRPITFALPLQVLGVAWTNYFTYCHSYGGTVCWRPDDAVQVLGRVGLESVISCVGFLGSVVVVYGVATRVSVRVVEGMRRRRWRQSGRGLVGKVGDGRLEAVVEERGSPGSGGSSGSSMGGGGTSPVEVSPQRWMGLGVGREVSTGSRRED